MRGGKAGRIITWAVVVAVIVLVVSAVAASLGGVPVLAPARVLARYPAHALASEVVMMDRCTECHPAAEMHTCESCHDEHGSMELAGVPFDTLLLLTGDVPKPEYIPVNDLFPQREKQHTFVILTDLLAEAGVQEFESVTLFSTDGGQVTIARADLTAEAMLLPYVEGVRFAAENLHASSWLKGITRIVVVGTETPLKIDGQATSIGRLLLGPTQSVTLEQTDVMLESASDGQVRRAKTASRAEGAPLSALLAQAQWKEVQVRDDRGREYTFKPEELQAAMVALIQGKVTLVLPDRGRPQWVSGVVEITSR